MSYNPGNIVKRKSILIVANTTWNIFNFRLNVVNKFILEGFHVFIAAPIDKFIHYKKLFPDVEHISIDWLKRDGLNPIRELLLILELNKIYKKVNPDLILHYTIKPNIYGGMAAFLQGKPSIAVVTGLGYAFLKGGWLKGISKLLYRLACKLHNEIIFENQDDRLLFYQSKLIDTSKGISIKGCGVNTRHYLPQVSKPPTGLVTFTFIGRMIYDKGIAEFVAAAKILKSKYENVRFWMVGDIDDSNPSVVKKDDLRNWISDEIITYHGSTEDVRKFIAASDCIVLPSYREAIARSITESMSMGKPVIASDTAGCREAIDHEENGFLTPVKDAYGLSIAMQKFIDLNQSQRLAMGKAGREKVLSEFDDQIIAQQLFEVAQKVLKGLTIVNTPKRKIAI